MAVICTTKDNAGLIKITGPLLASTAGAFREQFGTWRKAESDLKDIVIDLSDVDMMDSAGLGGLIAVLKGITEGGGNLKIACLQKNPRMVFEITRTYRILIFMRRYMKRFKPVNKSRSVYGNGIEMGPLR
ncbi:MAG: STAS domain-containing protein [Kiritimatiellae bacterium]|nr:STAS domain-containing protein [Kiritimatiellia bacterium]